MTARKMGGFADPADEELAQAPEDYTALPPDWASQADVSARPDSDPSEGLSAPPLMEPGKDSHVPPELRVSTLLARQRAIEKASQQDRQRQDQADTRAYLLAAGRREAPQLHNIGTPEMQKVLAQYGAQPEKEPAYKLSDLEKLRAKPVDILGDRIKALQALEAEKRLATAPKDTTKKPLDAEARAYWKGISGHDLAPGATEDDVKILAQYVNPQAQRTQGAAQFGETLGERRRQDAEDEANRMWMRENKEIPATTLEAIADSDTAIKSLDALGTKFKEKNLGHWGAGPAAAVSSKLGLSNDYTEFNDAALVAMQGVGKIMEGGKLAAGDETKYRAMLPRPGDSVERAQEKLADAKMFLAELRRNRVAILRGSGYRPIRSTSGGGKTFTVRNLKTGERYPAVTAEQLAELKKEPDFADYSTEANP